MADREQQGMRRADWQLQLSAFVQERSDRPFDWGSNDCCTFAAGAVEALTGRNPMAGIESYATEFGALRMVEEGGGLHALATSLLGASVSPLLAAVGDVVLVMNAGREMLAVCNGTNAIAPGMSGGIVALGMNAALAAWKI